MSLTQSGNDTPESGHLPGRLEWVPEPTPGEVPSDPEYELFSDNYRSFEMDVGASVARQDGASTPDAVDHQRGMEEPGGTVGYDLQRFPVAVNFADPSASTQLGVKSTDSVDTSLDVTIYNDDGTVSETISTDGTDATTFVPGSTSFDSIGRVTVSGSHTGAIEVLEDNSGSAGTKLGELASGETDLEDVTPTDPAGYGMVRDRHNNPPGRILVVARRDHPGGNDDAGVREFSVIRGAGVDPTATLDPSGEQPILIEAALTARKARSYLIHQPASSTDLEVTSTSSNDTMDLTVESEDADVSTTVTLNGTNSVTISGPFPDVDAAWLTDNPEGTVTITDGSGTTILTLEGGNTYSDDGNPVDGDRGVPVLGSGSHASAIGGSYEHFEGDRFERPVGSSVRARVNSASWTFENGWSASALHDGRAPAVDAGNRVTSVDADVAGPFVTHDSMMESLQKDQQDLEHELTSGIIRWVNATPTGSATRTIEADQAVASVSETFEPSGEPEVEFEEV